MKASIVGGMTQQAYHIIPDDKDLIITNPTKVGIFNFLAQIGFDKFPEFITDVLTKVEKHTLVDITDGPGDEKQDVLTITPEGKRCLTQCKHTTDITKNSNGDELDIMVAACMRKNCKEAIFVTNTDLTPQAKKYVTDEEYLRGQTGTENPITVDYWNDARIWEKIKDNTDILNKWFSGLGQTHGLRNFKFELTVQVMPFTGDTPDGDNFDSILAGLVSKNLVAKIEGRYVGKLPDGTTIFLHRWFQFTSRLNINYVLPKNDQNFLARPLYALTVEVHIPSTIKYVPSIVQKEVVDFLLNNTLAALEWNQWWHITCSQAKSFIFLHDISETREIILNSAQTFVKINGANIVPEMSYCGLPKPDFELLSSSDEGDDSIFVYKPQQIHVVQLFDQLIDPYYVYEQQVLRLEDLELYKTYSFRAIKGIDSHMIRRVQKIIDTSWVAVQIDNDTLAWGFPKETDQSHIDFVEKKLEVLGLQVLHIKDSDRDMLLGQTRKDMPPATYMYISDLSKLSVPIDLSNRIIWLYKDLIIPQDINDENAMSLVKYKYEYESRHGFENMGGKREMRTHTSELPNLLFDFFTIRGNNMLDMRISDNSITIHLRIRARSIEGSESLILRYIPEFLSVLTDIDQLLAK